MVIITEEASSSTSNHIYDVFLSFRGADTRNNFTNHLHKALEDANIKTFLDDSEIETGLYLKPELESAIRASRASIIVLSKNYASSTWCLNELVLILEQHRMFNQIVFPIFYHVEPTAVRNLTGSFKVGMDKHRKKMDEEPNTEIKSVRAQKIDIWEKALAQFSNLKGKEPKDRLETEFIEDIVTDIYRQLGVPLRSILSSQDPKLIGIDDSIKFLSSWLKDRSQHTTDILTILGMGGIGKTSLAKHVYKLHCREFNRSSFVENISRRCVEQSNGLLDLQKQLCDDISKASLNPVHDVSVYTSTIENTLARKKVFIVLDDIDSLDQLDVLLGNKGFYPGSKIIITTKDASLTQRCELFNSQVQPKHKTHLLKSLYESASLELLCLHAFKCGDPKQGYKEVSDKIVKYCQGHPLALKVLGRSLRNRDVAYWEDWIEKLNEETDSRINKVLRMSFDSLPSQKDKELFKHIACFFVGMDIDVAETILIACRMKAMSGITNLMDRCLLSIGWNNELIMHQLVQEMGRDAARQESPRRRLWCDDGSFQVLRQKEGKENILGLALDMRMLEKEKFKLKPDALSKMENLKLLQLNYVKDFLWHLNFPEELKWLCMRGFPLKSIPSEIPMETVVVLDMSYSKLESFDMSFIPLEGRKLMTGSCSKHDPLLGSLKILDLSYCNQLRNLGGFQELPSLQNLFLRNCSTLIEVSESIDHCDELVFIDLSNCKELIRMHPRMLAKLKKVKKLVLEGCNIGELGMEVVPRDSKSLAIYLPSSLVSLSLANNKLSNESFPMDLSCLSMLTDLCLDGNPIVSMPNCVRSLHGLKALSMNDCEMLVSIEHPPRTLNWLTCHVASDGHKSLIQKIAFDPEMSPLFLLSVPLDLSPSSIEIEGMIKIQPIAGVDDTILCCLGWRNLEFINKRRVGTFNYHRGGEESQTQMYYEFGIFSTIYGGEVMPTWIRHRSMMDSISFTIPSSPQKLRGLNVCYVQTIKFPYRRLQYQHRDAEYPFNQLLHLPYIRISNITKNRTWIYKHHIEEVNAGGKYLTFLSHWMFGENEMEDGDQLIIYLDFRYGYGKYASIRECGVSFVYDDDDGKKENKEEDALSYYKSWNHIIGGDLSAFQLTTGEYFLQNMPCVWYPSFDPHQPHTCIRCDVFFKEEGRRRFKAFSHKNSNTCGGAIEDVSK